MPKQIKLGLDKVPAPVTKQFTQLIDIEGNLLFDAAGNPVVTEDEAVLGSFSKSASATSVFSNNYNSDKPISVPIAEQFSGESEVSSSILGVPRAEEQLSLFADVSTYGLDEENWNYYTFANATYPGEWYRKQNPVFGRRFNPKFTEESSEQALSISTFPSQYNFPGSTIAERREAPTANMQAYMNFIAMGKYLYTIFIDVNPVFAKANFLDTTIKVISSGELEFDTTSSSSFSTNGLAFSNDSNFHDVEYGDDLQESFDQIERWTYMYDRIVVGDASFPTILNEEKARKFKLEYDSIRRFLSSKSQPGGSSQATKFAILESKKTFRYQPGRASGFTFGVRQETDPSSNVNTIEWGCSNDTDEYMFQLVGSRFNIVRRSVIKLPDDLLLKQGLEVSDQSSSAIEPKGVGIREAMWETVIPRTKFNGDSLLGNGKSGYILSFEDVTMYKIEFSWYGAIGAKFYAYVPSLVGDARWVLMHRLVIENGLGKPILKNPDFKFKYMIFTEDNATMQKPVSLYKYGSSYYVDGGDEGTIRLATTTVDSKDFTQRSPILGILPKQKIFNQDGEGLTNFKKAYPSTMSISSDIDARIDVEDISGSPDGVHFNFSPSLHNGVHALSTTLDFRFIGSAGSQVDILSGPTLIASNFLEGTKYEIVTPGNTNWTDIGSANASVGTKFIKNAVVATGTGTAKKVSLGIEDDNAHIIADGIYNAYVDYDYDPVDHESSSIRRRNGSQVLITNSIRKYEKYDGTVEDTINSPTFTGRLSNYHALAASTVPIYGNNFKIHFLNPSSKDNGRHFAEFAISVTSKLPIIDSTDNNKLKFTDDAGVSEPYDIYGELHQEYACEGTPINYSTKAERYEWDPGYSDMFMVDNRIPSPLGADSGYISAVKGEVRVVSYSVESVAEGTGDFAGKWKITFAGGAPSTSLFTVDSSGNIVPESTEIGVASQGIGVYYVTLPEQGDDGKSFAYVYPDPTDDGSGPGSRTITSIQTKTITLTHDWQLDPGLNGDSFTKSKAVKFNAQPLYLVVGLKDNAKVNNIIVEEFTADQVLTHTPVFIKDAPNLTVVGSGSSTNILSPSAFQAGDRLSSIRFDDQCLNPLRPGTKIYSLFVKGGVPEKFDLSNIFGRDRKGLARGLLNNSAVYLTASAVDGTSVGNVELTITVKEQ
jgi:hypothetical protein